MVELTGQKFGKLLVIEFDRVHTTPGGSKKRMWKCLCDCGNQTVVAEGNLKSGNSKSCGCTRLKKSIARLTKHGGTNTRLYNIWCGMKYRCSNSSYADYKYYGGRGIKIYEPWVNDFALFRKWAMQNGYDDTLTVDRIDVDGDYSPENCRWVDYTTQANNRTNNVFIEYSGETHTIAEWSRITGLTYDHIRDKLRYGHDMSTVLASTHTTS